MEIFALPVLAHKATGFFKVGADIHVLFFPLNFALDFSARLSPLIQNSFGFFISALFL